MSIFEPVIETVPEVREISPDLPLEVRRRLYARLRDEEDRVTRRRRRREFLGRAAPNLLPNGTMIPIA